MLHLQRLLRSDADRLSDAMAVLRPPLQHLENEQVERTLHKFDSVGHIYVSYYSRLSTRGRLPGRRFSGSGAPNRTATVRERSPERRFKFRLKGLLTAETA